MHCKVPSPVTVPGGPGTHEPHGDCTDDGGHQCHQPHLKGWNVRSFFQPKTSRIATPNGIWNSKILLKEIQINGKLLFDLSTEQGAQRCWGTPPVVANPMLEPPLLCLQDLAEDPGASGTSATCQLE